MINQKQISAAASISLFIFAIITVLVTTGTTASFDHFVYNKTLDLLNPAIYTVLAFVTNFGSATAIISSYLILFLFLFTEKKHRELAAAIFGALGGTISGEILRLVIARPRPTPFNLIEVGFSFPSGHTLATTIFFGLLVYIIKDKFSKKWMRDVFSAVCLILILVIGMSRIYLGVHFASDVFGGFFLGIFWLYIAIFISKIPNQSSTQQNI